MEGEQRCTDILRGCGIELVDNQQPILHTSATMFKYKLNEAVRNDSDVAQLIGDFMDSLLSDHDNIAKYLDPIELASDAGGNATARAPTSQQMQFAALQSESIVRLMLGIDAFQPRLIATLLERFPEFIGYEDDQGSVEPGATKVSVKILRQLRWLDYVIDSAGLTEKLLDTLSFVTPEMQAEIIGALPDIISDSDHAEASKVLSAMLKEDTPGLMLPILETLGSLDCSINILQDCRNSVIMRLLSAEPAELPVMIKFLLQSVTPETAAPTIHRIRKRLDLDSIVLVSRQLSRAASDQAPDMLIFDVVSTCLRCHKHLRDAWLKTISTDTGEIGPHTTLDIVVLLILHQVTTQTRRVETILKGKINAVSSQPVAYTPEVMESTISKFPSVFAAQFPALLAVSSWLIRTSPLGSQASRVASSMIVAAFGSMGMFQRQEISGELAVHIGSGNANEIDTAARIYLKLAQKCPFELRPFAIFIKGLLDYVDNLPIEHIRMIFDTLGILSTLNTSGGDDSMFNDLYIFVRKQLSSVYPKYNRIGIVGTVSLLRQLGTSDNTVYVRNAATLDPSAAGGSGSSQAPDENTPALRRAAQLLGMLIDSGHHQSWAFISMTYDELAHIVETKGLHPQLLSWLHENVSSKFAAQFLGDAEELSTRYGLPDQPSVALSLDEGEPTILDILNHNKDAVDLGLHAAVKCRSGAGSTNGDGSAGRNAKLRGCLLSCLPSFLRLMQVCEKALHDGSLADIDILLVCGLYLLPPIDISAEAIAASAGDGSVQQAAALFKLVADSDSPDDASRLIAGASLVGATEGSRAELLARVSTWPPELRRILCTSLYAASSWIREVINAFAGQPSAEVRGKVIGRINQLSQIEADLVHLAGTLTSTPNEFNPVSAGLVPEITDTAAIRTVGGPALRIRNGNGAAADDQTSQAPGTQLQGDRSMAYSVDIDGLLLSQDDTRKLVDEPFSEASAAVSSSKKRSGKRKGRAGASIGGSATADFARNPQQFLREFSLTAFEVLAIASAQAEDEGEDDASQQLISARGLDLVLRELGSVVSSKLSRQSDRKSPAQRHQGSESSGSIATFSSNIADSSAGDIAKHALHLLPSLLAYLACCLAIRARFRNDVEAADHFEAQPRIVSGVDTLDDITTVETCIDTLLHIISTVLHWDGLQGSLDSGSVDTSDAGINENGHGRSSIMRSVLGALAEQGSHTGREELEDMDTDVLVRRAFDCLLCFADMAAAAGRAVSILRMLVAIRGFAPHCELAEEMQCMTAEQRENTMDGRISALARRILTNEWSGMSEVKPADLEYVVMQSIMRYPHNRLELTHKYATRILTGFAAGNSDAASELGGSHASLRRSTFATYYKAVTQMLAQTIRDSRLGEMNGREIVGVSTTVAESWLALSNITQRIEGSLQRSVLLIALRGGNTLVDLFTKMILPLLDSYFLIHRDEILTLFSRVQKSTRILQNICNHSKVAKDVALQSAVPQMKRKLESLIFQVIAMMEHNDCIGAINLGNLKHRDLRGQIVSSQIPLSDEESEGEEPGPGFDVDAGYEGHDQGEDDEGGDHTQTRRQAARPPTKRGKGSRGGSKRPQNRKAA
ncbi:Fanconi anemia group D2 protein [Dipsacomyces acuminosporus]|nr:Fanconi anemia group D2 protein [Dipsacomyces acuminosporus]